MRTFPQLFVGSDAAYGIKLAPKKVASPGEKVESDGKTIKSPLTLQHYQDHLAGTTNLGVIPIRPDGTCKFGCIDIDDYKLDHKALNTKIRDNDLPFVLTRSTSGGGHLWLFISGDGAPAKDVIAVLKKYAAELGLKNPEIFPKQSQFIEGSIGNWVCLPYHRDVETVRYAFGLNNEKLSLFQFEQMAYALTITPAELLAMTKKPSPVKDKPDFMSLLPPCIRRMKAEGVLDNRNNALTHIAIVAKKAAEDIPEGDWTSFVNEMAYSSAFPSPMTYTEINQIINNITKSKSDYLCQKEPCASLCDKDTCLTMKWGVGAGRGAQFSPWAMDKYIVVHGSKVHNRVVWDGVEFEINTEEMLSPTKLQVKVFEQTGQMISLYKRPMLQKMIMEVPREEEVVPEEELLPGIIWETFEDWCTTSNCAEIGGVLNKLPYYDDVEKVIIFRSRDLVAEVCKVVPGTSREEVNKVMGKKGAQKKSKRVIGKVVRLHYLSCDEPWFDIRRKDTGLV